MLNGSAGGIAIPPALPYDMKPRGPAASLERLDTIMAPADSDACRRMASLGTKKIDFTVPSLTGLGDRHFANVGELEYEVGNARIWGGIHFRSAVEDGIKIAKKTANYVLAHDFHREEH